jgi:hypothetical protein
MIDVYLIDTYKQGSYINEQPTDHSRGVGCLSLRKGQRQQRRSGRECRRQTRAHTHTHTRACAHLYVHARTHALTYAHIPQGTRSLHHHHRRIPRATDDSAKFPKIITNNLPHGRAALAARSFSCQSF